MIYFRQRNFGTRTSFQQGRGGNQYNFSNRGNIWSGPVNNGRINKPAGRHSGGGDVVDLRHLIIKKNRMHISDARDKLANIAKFTGDLRTKIHRRNTNRVSSFLEMQV